MIDNDLVGNGNVTAQGGKLMVNQGKAFVVFTQMALDLALPCPQSSKMIENNFVRLLGLLCFSLGHGGGSGDSCTIPIYHNLRFATAPSLFLS